MSTTKKMTVANEAFLLDRLAADAPPLQQIRELTQNAIEAIARRQESGDQNPGLIKWDIDWNGVRRLGAYKLSITDNGDGMSSQEMIDYLNSLAVQGAGESQALEANFGVGAKITALFHNHAGLVYQSWQDGVGHMVRLHLDRKQGVYGLSEFPDPTGGITYTPRLADNRKPSSIDKSGTTVILMGASEEENTAIKPEGASGGATNWLYKYLNTRYYVLPPGTRIQVRNMTKDSDHWPEIEPPVSDKTYNFETIRGMKTILDENAADKGTLRLQTARVHWWLFENPKEVDKKINPRAFGPGHVGLIFQNEVYFTRSGNAGRKLMAMFGIIYGAEYVVLYVEPNHTDLTIRANTDRSTVLIDGVSADDGSWWETWGVEFKEKMPSAIKAMMERLISEADTKQDESRRQRVLDRLEKIKYLLNPSRYRTDPQGKVRAENRVTGGQPGHLGSTHEPPSKESRPRRMSGGRAAEYLADLIDQEGERAEPIRLERQPPTVRWVSEANGLRGEDELVDMAAEIPGDEVTGNLIKANEDFRGFTDMINAFADEFGADDDAILSKIKEVVEEWAETQLLEIVVTVRNLEDGKVWSRDRIKKALGTEALTTAMMARYFIVEKARRMLGNELARPKPVRANVAAE